MNSSIDNKFIKFDNMIFPVIAVDKSGVLIYKNKYAAKIKVFKLGTKILKFISKNCHARFFESLNSGKSAFFECTPKFYYSYFALINIDENCSLIFLILNSCMLEIIKNKECIDKAYKLKGLNEYILKEYIKYCKLYNIVPSDKIDKIFEKNSLRFKQACRHFNFYIQSFLTNNKGMDFYNCNISELVKKIVDYSSLKLSALGYRIYLSNPKDMIVSKIPREIFLTIFMSIEMTVLQISKDANLYVNLSQDDKVVTVKFTFNTPDIAKALEHYSVDVNFQKEICSKYGWEYYKICDDESGMCSIYLKIPAIIDYSVPIKAEEIFKNEFDYKIIDEELSVLNEI